MTEHEIIELVKKHSKITELLCDSNFPPMLFQFFDECSDELLDEKIEVLKALKAGKTIDKIPHFYDILELYPKNGEMWD